MLNLYTIGGLVLIGFSLFGFVLIDYLEALDDE